jgi:hypothetical protein
MKKLAAYSACCIHNELTQQAVNCIKEVSRDMHKQEGLLSLKHQFQGLAKTTIFFTQTTVQVLEVVNMLHVHESSTGVPLPGTGFCLLEST